MILFKSANAPLRLDDADNFKAFKLVVEGLPKGELPDMNGITPAGDDHVLVTPETVTALAGQPAGSAWHGQFEGMVKAAAKYGWVDEATGAIKAHVEWQ